jgi:transcriptional regulator with PAS, ATPase and Fis domain
MFTHCLDELSFYAIQQETSNDLYNNYIETFTKYCDEQYVLGVSENKIFLFEETTDLQLRATTVAIVENIQKTKPNRLLKVLSDSRSDRTMFKRISLPKGVQLLHQCKQKVVSSHTVTFQAQH